LALLTLVANQIGEPFLPDGGLADLDTTTTALESLAQLLESCHPASLSSNPIELLELLTNTDELSYLPITFGYVTYATPGVRRHPASFDALPRGPRGSAGGVLGGAGLGISASSKHLAQAAAFASFVASPTVQAGAYTVGGGQPGHRSAWLDPGVNRHHGDVCAATWNGIDESYLRPRWPGYLSAQTAAAKAVHAWLTDRHTPAAAVVRTLDALFSTTFASSVSQLANLNPNSFSTY
ncbi:MAG: hypothetical protein VB093_00170, partial [Propionicimonas sp.]|nr:hypothetical protein [Propionicimonas sp.]